MVELGIFCALLNATLHTPSPHRATHLRQRQAEARRGSLSSASVDSAPSRAACFRLPRSEPSCVGRSKWGSDVDILKKSISIRYDIFQNLYWYNIDIFKMLVIKERCHSYNLNPVMLDRYFLATFRIIMGILFNRKVDWL